MKCLTLCWILASCAWAVQPTQLSIGLSPAQIGQRTFIRGAFAPRNVDEGTVSFTSDGAPLPDCQSVPVRAGEAECYAAFPAVRKFTIGATYTGSSKWAPAVAKPVVLTVGTLAPWVYLAMDPKEPVYGNNLILNALVLGAEGYVPTGTITFFENGIELVTRPLGPDQRAGLGLPLAAGPHTIGAMYSGDANYQRSVPVWIDFTVGRGKPVVAISSTPAQIGQPILVSASVTARNPTGTITFEGLPQCAGLRLDAKGFAYCRTVYPQLGEYSITATYSGDANLGPESATLRIGVAKAVAGLYVATSPGSPVYGQTVRLTALLMGAQGLPRPGGSVSFTADASPAGGAAVIDGEGRATWPATFAAGVQRVTASFPGDPNYAPALAPVTFLVGRANTTTTLSAPAAGPFTATVTAVAPGSGTPTGNVRFSRDGVAIGSAALVKGSATLVATGAGTITAEYPGDNNFTGSSSSATAPAAKALVTLSSDRNPVAAGQPVTFTAVVVPNPGTVVPAGSVQFTVNGASLGTIGLSAGRATLTATLGPGSHSMEAAYSGDAIYPAASGALTQVMTGAQSGLGLSATVPAPVFGQPVTFMAHLPSGGTGTVKFSDGAVVLGSAALTGGTAVLSVPALAVGTHPISASWSGDAMYASATAELSYTVARAGTATALTLGTGAASARVSAVAPGAGTPTGTVRFVNPRNDALLASATLSNGAATAILPRDAGLVTAMYSGDANFVESVSATASALTVVNAASYLPATVAPDEIVTLFGPIPAGLASIQVTDRAGATREAQVLHSVAGQAAVVLPSELATGPATVAAGEWQALVTVARTAPGLFTADASGKGAPAGLTDPIEIGDEGAAIVLYGTGLRHAAAKPVCLVGGQPVEVLYAGAQGEFPGLDQVNVLLPPALRGSGAVMLELKVDGVSANPVTLTIR